MQPSEVMLYNHLKEQQKLIEKQLAVLQEAKRQTEQDIQRIEQQQKERRQLNLF